MKERKPLTGSSQRLLLSIDLSNYKLANFSSKRIIWQVNPYSLSYHATVLTSWKFYRLIYQITS
ncbi:hypothetical protein B1P86_06465 [Enterococcus faecium]|nr:hypothetical protein B1P86_06465 [Enterococcus faecium]